METRRPPESMAASASNGQPTLGRRALLGMTLAWALARPRWSAAAATESRKGSFNARAALLFGAFRFEESGAIDETIDRSAGRYEVRITGRGSDMTTEIESTGALRDGRWVPLRFADKFLVYGRESRLEIAYDYSQRVIRYQGR